MHKIIASYVKQFVRENELCDLDEAAQFEYFVNYCATWHDAVEAFDLERIGTSDNDDGIDGAAVILDGEVITTAEEAREIFKGLGARRSIEARYVFCQAKRSESFDLGDMLKLGTGVASLFAGNRDMKDEVLAEVAAIHDVVVENVSYVANGRPLCTLYFACTGVWNENNGLRGRAIGPTIENLTRLGLFHELAFVPVDRDLLIALWMKTREPVKATFSVKGTVALPAIKGVSEAYLALAPGREFITNVLTDQDGRIRTSVFEQNVRAFLGDDNPVNARIRVGLEASGKHDRFAINNNGITIVAPDVRVQSDRVSVTDFQIVNGCQTSHVLYRSRDKVSDEVWLPLKIIEAQDPDVVAQLVESTNSQTTVSAAQFLSIRPFTQRIEAYFNAFEDDGDTERRLFFERRTNQYAGQNIGSRSHPESGCILNRLPRNPQYFSVNSWMIVNMSYDRYLRSKTVVDFGSCEVFSMVFV